METKHYKLNEIKNLYDSNLISIDEYNKLSAEIFGEETTVEKEYNNTQRIKNAGQNVLNIFYCIVIQPVLFFAYSFFIGYKVGYDSASNVSSTLENFIDYIKNLSNAFYFIEIVITIYFLTNLWNLGNNLKNVDN